MNRLYCLAMLAPVTACGSPEAERTLGGGPGADTGNRGEIVRMHEGSKPYYETPQASAVQAPPLDGARHAYQQSRP